MFFPCIIGRPPGRQEELLNCRCSRSLHYCTAHCTLLHRLHTNSNTLHTVQHCTLYSTAHCSALHTTAPLCSAELQYTSCSSVESCFPLRPGNSVAFLGQTCTTAGKDWELYPRVTFGGVLVAFDLYLRWLEGRVRVSLAGERIDR